MTSRRSRRRSRFRKNKSKKRLSKRFNKYGGNINDDLFNECIAGQYGIATNLLLAGADPNYIKNGITVLFFACYNNADEFTKTLLDFNADPNIGEEDGGSVLHLFTFQTPIFIWLNLYKNHL